MASFDFDLPYRSRRSPVLARNVVATSQPLAAQAGLAMMRAGGNAVDAALAAAIALTVVEPTSNGVGGDAFCILWDGRELHGLNASGRSPAGWTRDRFAGLTQIPGKGWDSVTVPGAVSAWVALSRRFGRLAFAQLFEPALAYAKDGFPVSPIVAGNWARGARECGGQPGFDEAFLPKGRAPRAGEIFANPALARSLAAIAASEGEAFYEGGLAAAMVDFAAACGGALSRADLASHRADWVTPLGQKFGPVTLHEMPPNGQGIAALIAAGILTRLGIERHSPDSPEAMHLGIEAMKLGFADAEVFVADDQAMRIDPAMLLTDAYLSRRATLVDPERAGDYRAGTPRGGGTVYVAAGDASGMMVSLIQSNYDGFGSGVVVPGTGISLQNRGTGFVLDPGHANEVGPRKRPRHSIMPGFVTCDGKPAMAFGVQGGPMQPQAHLQLVLRAQIAGQNPQAANDAPRWRFIKEKQVGVEAGMPPAIAASLAAKGHDVVQDGPEHTAAYGGAQLLCRIADAYVAGSDPRKDGCAVGF